MLRMWTSANWLVGALALAAAVAWPLAHHALTTSGDKVAAESLVNAVWSAQQRVYGTRGQYVYFTGSERDAAQAALDLSLGGDIMVDAVSAGTSAALLLRAYPSSSALRSGQMAPFLYTFEVSEPGGEGQGAWTPLSGRTPGLTDVAALF